MWVFHLHRILSICAHIGPCVDLVVRPMVADRVEFWIVKEFELGGPKRSRSRQNNALHYPECFSLAERC